MKAHGKGLAEWQARVAGWQRRLPDVRLPVEPTALDAAQLLARHSLIVDEMDEFLGADDAPHSQAAELADVLFLVLGTFNLMGIDAEQALDAVADGNDAKIAGGVVTLPSGRICKPAGWTPPADALRMAGLRPARCPGIELDPAVYSGCEPLPGSQTDCPVCHPA